MMLCEVWVLVDANGDYVVGMDADSARSSYADNIGGLDECDGFRLVKMIVEIPKPAVVDLPNIKIKAADWSAAEVVVSEG